MSVFAPVRLFQGVATTSEVTQYTVPAATKVLIKQVVINNTAAVAVTFGISLVPTAGSATVANRIFGDVVMAAGQVVILDLSQVMNTGDFLSMKASAATSVTVTASGVTVV